jgi:hypothetical protein
MTNRIVLSPMFAEIISTALHGVDGMAFTVPLLCPHCEDLPGKGLLAHDTIKRRFATVVEGDNLVKITVSVKRFTCKKCGKIVLANSPFYPNTRVGSPVIDLAMSLAFKFSYYQASQIMGMLGIPMNRGAIRSLAQSRTWTISSVPMSGLLLPASFLTLGMLMSTSSIAPTPEEVLAACGFLDA